MQTLKETSKDDSDISDIQYMTESEMEAVNFDQVKRNYVNALGLSEHNAASVDAIMSFADNIAFIEFKKGVLQKSPSRIAIADHIAGKANEEHILFDLERYKKLYVKEVHTYSKEKFAEYLNKQQLLQ